MKKLFFAAVVAGVCLQFGFSQEEDIVKDLYPVSKTSELEDIDDVDFADDSEDFDFDEAEETAEMQDETDVEQMEELPPSPAAVQPENAGVVSVSGDNLTSEAAGNSEESSEAEPEKPKSRAGISTVPSKKKPKPIDREKAEAAAEKDEDEEVPEKNRNTIKFGIPSEISSLIDELTSGDDPRFTDEIYELFQVTQNAVIQQKVLEYFTKLEDPCVEDFAVELLNDPYDSRKDVVHAAFIYIQKVHTKEAIPAVLTLLESENESYFNDSLATIGEIGEAEEAVFLAEYLDREDLSDAQRQSLMRTLGKLHAVETYDKIVEILENEDENSFVRMYAAESLGFMEKDEAVPVLVNAFTSADPNLRQYAVKGLSHFPKVVEAQATIIQAVRDEHWKVRQEAIKACQELELKEAVPYLTYRAENDKERVIKEAAIVCLSKLNSSAADNFLKEMLDKKIADNIKIKVVQVLLEADHGEKEILELAEKCVDDVKYKNLCKGIGKELSKHSRHSFAGICQKYLESKDSDIVALGLDMYKNCKMGAVEPQLRLIAEDKKANSTNRNRAKKFLGIKDEEK